MRIFNNNRLDLDNFLHHERQTKKLINSISLNTIHDVIMLIFACIKEGWEGEYISLISPTSH